MPRINDPIDRLISSTFEVSRIMRQHLCDSGNKVNFLQIHALLIISDQKGITMKELASALHITSPSATTFVDRLVKLGWVERKADPKNRKLVRLSLTRTGTAALHQVHAERSKVVRTLFSFLTSREQELLAEIHEKILRRYAEKYPSR